MKMIKVIPLMLALLAIMALSLVGSTASAQSENGCQNGNSPNCSESTQEADADCPNGVGTNGDCNSANDSDPGNNNASDQGQCHGNPDVDPEDPACNEDDPTDEPTPTETLVPTGTDCPGSSCDDVPGQECENGQHTNNPHCDDETEVPTDNPTAEPTATDTEEERKVDVCHFPPGNPENAHVISISVNALDAHLSENHDDFVMEEGDTCPRVVTTPTDEPEATETAEPTGEPTEEATPTDNPTEDPEATETEKPVFLVDFGGMVCEKVGDLEVNVTLFDPAGEINFSVTVGEWRDWHKYDQEVSQPSVNGVAEYNGKSSNFTTALGVDVEVSEIPCDDPEATETSEPEYELEFPPFPDSFEEGDCEQNWQWPGVDPYNEGFGCDRTNWQTDDDDPEISTGAQTFCPANGGQSIGTYWVDGPQQFWGTQWLLDNGFQFMEDWLGHGPRWWKNVLLDIRCSEVEYELEFPPFPDSFGPDDCQQNWQWPDNSDDGYADGFGCDRVNWLDDDDDPEIATHAQTFCPEVEGLLPVYTLWVVAPYQFWGTQWLLDNGFQFTEDWLGHGNRWWKNVSDGPAVDCFEETEEPECDNDPATDDCPTPTEPPLTCTANCDSGGNDQQPLVCTDPMADNVGSGLPCEYPEIDFDNCQDLRIEGFVENQVMTGFADIQVSINGREFTDVTDQLGSGDDTKPDFRCYEMLWIRSESPEAIWIANADGSDARPLLRDGERVLSEMAVWGFNGEIFYIDNVGLHVTDKSGTEYDRDYPVGSYTHLQLSADGNWILLDLADSNAIEIVSISGPRYGHYSFDVVGENFAFDPDGSRIVFSQNGQLAQISFWDGSITTVGINGTDAEIDPQVNVETEDLVVTEEQVFIADVEAEAVEEMVSDPNALVIPQVGTWNMSEGLQPDIWVSPDLRIAPEGSIGGFLVAHTQRVDNN